MHLLGRQHVELARAADAQPLGVGGGVGRDPSLPLGAPEDAVQEHEDLRDRAARELAFDEQALAVRVDPRGVDRARPRVGAELRQQIAPHRVAIVADRRRPAVLLVRDARQPRVARLAERVVLRALAPRIGGLAHAGGEQLLERRLRLSGRQIRRVRLGAVRRPPDDRAARRATTRVARMSRPEPPLVAARPRRATGRTTPTDPSDP
jgi:hypothetical protein